MYGILRHIQNSGECPNDFLEDTLQIVTDFSVGKLYTFGDVYSTNVMEI